MLEALRERLRQPGAFTLDFGLRNGHEGENVPLVRVWPGWLELLGTRFVRVDSIEWIKINDDI